MLLTKIVKIRWGSRNKEWLKEKGYIFTKIDDEIVVKPEDLTNNSRTLVEIKCDCEKCSNPNKKSITWLDYKRGLNKEGKYYCQECKLKYFSIEKHKKTKLKNGMSFAYWCIKNLTLKEATNIIARWDEEKNDCKPNEITFSSNGLNGKGYWFKCDKHSEHESELKSIQHFASGRIKLKCNQCNSFEQWCINNNKKDILERWDYKLNNCNPIDIPYSTPKKYYFKCPRGIHESELKNINTFTSRKTKLLECNQCNSFAQYNIDKLGEDFLEKYWDYKLNKNVNPWEVSYGCNKPKVWIKCQEKDYHESYQIECSEFSISNRRCSYCGNYKVHPLDSLGQLLEDKGLLNLWSDKNNKSPYEYAPFSIREVYWKCPDGIHEDYLRKISGSNIYDFRCPSCQFSKGEKRVEEYLINNKIDYIPQKEYEDLIGVGGGNLSYDFYLPQYRLLIEYQGEQHERYIKGVHKNRKKFEKQKEHDRRKKEYAENNKINLLPIWYWNFNNIEEILDKELNNIKATN